MAAETIDELRVKVVSLDRVGAVWRRTPAHQTIAFDETVSYEVLILKLDGWIVD